MAPGLAKLAFCTGGIYASYLTQGLVQEQLSTRRYGPEQRRFTQIVFLNLAQTVVCLCWAALWRAARPSPRDSAPARTFWLPALSNAVGPALGIIALKNISYTAQVLAKSCKLIPVMVAGTLLYGKRYSAAEYLAAALIAGGIVLFALVKNSGAVLNKLASPHAPVGYLLVSLNLGLDAYTNATQDRIKERYPSTTPQQFMFYMNLWCSLYYTVYMFALTGTGMEAIEFLGAYPEALEQVLLYCVCGAAGQNFIFISISSFGSVVNITITTTRKFFNVLLSVFYNKSSLRPGQWAGVLLVFGGLTQQIVLKNKPRPKAA